MNHKYFLSNIMQSISIRKLDNFQIRLNGRIAYEYCNHLLIRFDNNNHCFINHSELYRQNITLSTLNQCRIFDYRIDRISEYLQKQSDYIEGYIYCNKKDNQPVGCIWIAYKGANEFQYRVRHVDALGFNFAVLNDYRGKGIISYMIHDILLYLSTKGINSMYASVRKNNISAIKAYKKIGMNVVAKKRFFRIAGIRIPYPII